MSAATLVTARFDSAELSRLRSELGEVEVAGYGATGVVMSPAELRARVSDVQVLIVEFEQVDESVLAAAPRLRVIACCRNEPGASVDLAAAAARGIPVIFAPGRNAVSVAEFTMGLLISAARSIPQSHHLLSHTAELTASTYKDRDGRRDSTAQWSLDPEAPFARFLGVELSQRVLGIVGVGLIGREIASRARAFGMTVLGYDPYIDKAVARQLGVELVELDDLATRSDFVAVAAKVTAETRGLISGEFFEKMKSTAHFVNTARAAIVDYEALESALKTGKIRSAALDVFPIEPLPNDSRFRALSNVILTPHLAGATSDVVLHHSRHVVDQLEDMARSGFFGSSGLRSADGGRS